MAGKSSFWGEVEPAKKRLDRFDPVVHDRFLFAIALSNEQRRSPQSLAGAPFISKIGSGNFRILTCLLVKSTAPPHVILTPEKLAPLLRTRRHRPLFLIDLAIPRDINPAVHNLNGVYLYDLDALQSMAERTLEVRRRAAENCHRLIEQHVRDFQLWIERPQSPGFLPSPAARRTWE